MMFHGIRMSVHGSVHTYNHVLHEGIKVSQFRPICFKSESIPPKSNISEMEVTAREHAEYYIYLQQNNIYNLSIVGYPQIIM